MSLVSFAATHRRRSLFLIVPVLLALTALVAACGGSSSKSGVASATTTTTTGRSGSFAAARAKFVSCLESHGVPASQATRSLGFRRGPGSSNSTDSSTSTSSAPSSPPTTTAAYAAAFSACRRDLPAGSGRGGAFLNTAAGRAYLQCLQVHGVTVPSTTVPGQGFGSLANSPAFRQARTACAALAPARPGGASSSTSSLPGGV